MTNLNEWLTSELETVNKNKHSNEDYAPALKLEEGHITEVTVDFTNSFPTWNDPKDGKVRKIIPCTVKGAKASWWVNPANPVYKQILELGVAGRSTFKVMRTGQLKATRYTIVRE